MDGLSRSQSQQRGLQVSFLEADQDLQNLALALFHSAVITFENPKLYSLWRTIGNRGLLFPAQVVPQIPQWRLPTQGRSHRFSMRQMTHRECSQVDDHLALQTTYGRFRHWNDANNSLYVLRRSIYEKGSERSYGISPGTDETT